MTTYINLKRAQTALMQKSLYDFIIEMWSAYESVPYSDCWLVEWQSECYMYSVKHFLPRYVWQDWIDDKQYEGIKKEANAVCPVRDKLYDGKHVRNHNWNMPPRHMKSSIMNVCGPVWTVINTPISVASVSHTARLSSEMNMKRQKLMSSEQYRYYFGDDIKNRVTKCSATNIQTVGGGSLFSVCQASFTGFGADVILADDLISSDNATKDAKVLKNVLTFFRNTLPTRLNTAQTGVIWHIQQRLAQGDISGLIQDTPELSRVYSQTALQAIAEDDINFIYPCSGKVKEIHKGDLLWPERFGDYTEVKAKTGSSVFNTQYQQNPAASNDTIIKEHHIHFIDDKDIQEFIQTADTVYASHDCPVKDAEINDYHGFTRAYGRGNQLLIVDSWENHLGYVEEKQLISSLQQIEPNLLQIIEDKANGAPIIQDLKADVPGLIPFNPGTNSKAQRLSLASSYMESGAVMFVNSEKTQVLRDRILKFPYVVHEDIMDSFTQLVLYHFTKRTNGVYTNCFTYENIVEIKEEPKNIIYAATINGELIKVLGVEYTYEGNFIGVKEYIARGLTQFEQLCERLGAIQIIDASYENSLYSIIQNPKILMVKFHDRDRDKSIHLMKTGFYKKKILVNKICGQTINDISKLRITTSSLNAGTAKIDTYDEGFAGCLRAIVTYQKGLGAIW